MRVMSYGLFWRRDEIEWNPGQGYRDSFRLLGRIGAKRGTIRIADFRYQQGIYILFDDYGPSYVGLTRDQGLGKRLQDHTKDRHRRTWDRFSWFGFLDTTKVPGEKGVHGLLDTNTEITDDQWTTIGDLEALLIRAIGPKHNKNIMNFDQAKEWTQIGWSDVDRYLGRVSKVR